MLLRGAPSRRNGGGSSTNASPQLYRSDEPPATVESQSFLVDGNDRGLSRWCMAALALLLLFAAVVSATILTLGILYATGTFDDDDDDSGLGSVTTPCTCTAPTTQSCAAINTTLVTGVASSPQTEFVYRPETLSTGVSVITNQHFSALTLDALDNILTPSRIAFTWSPNETTTNSTQTMPNVEFNVVPCTQVRVDFGFVSFDHRINPSDTSLNGVAIGFQAVPYIVETSTGDESVDVVFLEPALGFSTYSVSSSGGTRHYVTTDSANLSIPHNLPFTTSQRDCGDIVDTSCPGNKTSNAHSVVSVSGRGSAVLQFSQTKRVHLAIQLIAAPALLDPDLQPLTDTLEIRNAVILMKPWLRVSYETHPPGLSGDPVAFAP